MDALKSSLYITTTLFMILRSGITAGNLTCFYCHDTGENSNCRDEDYLKKSALSGEPFVRTCDESRGENYCFIERFIQHGVVNSLIRDCNDNETFSVRLKNIKLDNTTKCSFDPTATYQVCISLCQNSYCNGPLSSHPNSGEMSSFNIRIVSLLFVTVHVLLMLNYFFYVY